MGEQAAVRTESSKDLNRKHSDKNPAPFWLDVRSKLIPSSRDSGMVTDKL